MCEKEKFQVTVNNKNVDVIIRLAENENDLEQIINIENICFPPAEAAKREDFIDRYKAFKENFVVAEVDNTLIGFVNGNTTDKPELPDELYHDVSLHKPDGDYQTVFGLDVIPEYRHQGVAGHLMEYLIKLSKLRGKKGMVLTCKDHLIHFYEKFGFKHQGVSNSTHGGSVWNDMVYIF
ncbi:NH2-acetyltransferase [Anaeromyces robustus]|uniref:NH2-acetyltransferase n=1 Tax=Anaeromyces robustus TaxID=1754192 RepID=A0A1Y1XHX1_9FUNG|nr:NH2-acetyltransferase [Anaeromyces robustus]|eukprot:ORX85345.1 NH2-acetyltransferase [Anaeromyces robustus]